MCLHSLGLSHQFRRVTSYILLMFRSALFLNPSVLSFMRVSRSACTAFSCDTSPVLIANLMALLMRIFVLNHLGRTGPSSLCGRETALFRAGLFCLFSGVLRLFAGFLLFNVYTKPVSFVTL